jgi:hypothetical protein
MEWLLGVSLGNQALAGAAALAVCTFPASGRPIRTQLGALNSRASGPLFLQLCTGNSCGPRRSLAGSSPDPRRSTSDWGSEVLRRGSGEAPARLWRYERAVGGFVEVLVVLGGAIIGPVMAGRQDRSRRDWRGQAGEDYRCGMFAAQEAPDQPVLIHLLCLVSTYFMLPDVLLPCSSSGVTGSIPSQQKAPTT